jgi:hypothetical protein
MSTYNPNPQSPAPRYAERDRQSYGEIIAQNNHRAGAIQAEEGLWEDPAIARGMQTGQADSYARSQVYERKIADGRGVLGRSNPGPSWDALRRQELGAFAGAADFGEAGDANPYPFAPRAGANPHSISPLDGLARGERQGTVYGRAYAPDDGGRGRRNPADVTTEL